MKKQILLVVLMLCSMGAMAVSLPSKSYNVFSGTQGSTGPYTIGTGTTFANTSTVGSYTGTCENAGVNVTFGSVCTNCCAGEICGATTDSEVDACEEENFDNIAWQSCMAACQGEHLGYETPLDAPTAFLLALVAAYSAVAVYRRKTNATVA
jgi:hypothetical protein